MGPSRGTEQSVTQKRERGQRAHVAKYMIRKRVARHPREGGLGGRAGSKRKSAFRIRARMGVGGAPVREGTQTGKRLSIVKTSIMHQSLLR